MKIKEIGQRYVYEKVLAPSSVDSYLHKAEMFDTYNGFNDVRNLVKDDIFQWRDSLLLKGVRATSINSYVRHCRVLWHFAFEKKWVRDQSVFDIQRLPEIKTKKTVSDRSMNLSKKWLEDGGLENAWFWTAIFVLQSETGVRNMQLKNIKVGELNLSDGVLFCSPQGNKTNTSNEIPLTPKVVESMIEFFRHSLRVLARDLAPDDYVFEIARYDHRFKKYDDGMSTAQLFYPYRKLSNLLCDKTGERISGHRLRHTLATRIGSQPNVNIRVVQEFFGWSSIQTAQNYIQVGLSEKRDLINMLQK